METTNNQLRNSEEQNNTTSISNNVTNLDSDNNNLLENKSIDENLTSNTMTEENVSENENNEQVIAQMQNEETNEVASKAVETESLELEENIKENLISNEPEDKTVKIVEVVEKVKEEVSKEEEEKNRLLNINFSTLTNEELVSKLEEIIEKVDVQSIKTVVDVIKSIFYKNLHEETLLKKEKFEQEQKEKSEEEKEEFIVEADELSIKLKELLTVYRDKKTSQHKQEEQLKENNLKRKNEIIEKIKNLVSSAESTNNTFKEFRELQAEWREIGLVPQQNINGLWQTYHHHVESFYNYIKINKELKDLDLKKNLEAKISLCEQCEELMLKDSILDAFNMLQEYHNIWREIGPVAPEKKEEIWERFKEATKHINKKHQDHYTELKNEQENNLEAKTLICRRAEELSLISSDSNKEWEQNSKEIIELQKLWKSIGMVPRKDNDKIFKQFRNFCNTFFDNKKEFYSKINEIHSNNLQIKTDLCIQAEGLKDSTDWKRTGSDFINLQKKWKEVGPVPNKVSEQIWKRFRTACDVFFNNKNAYFKNLESDQQENLNKKNELLEKIQGFEPVENDEKANLEMLKNMQTEWNEISHVPFKEKDFLQKKYREAIAKCFKKLNIDSSKLEMLEFKTRIGSFDQESNTNEKLENEKIKVLEQMKQVEADIKLWENNIGFFSNSSKAESLLKDIYNKIETAKEKLKTYKTKLSLIHKEMNS